MSDDRLTELEIRYTLQQELMQQLSDVVARHEQDIAKLRRELAEMQNRLGDEGRSFGPNERPPHY